MAPLSTPHFSRRKDNMDYTPFLSDIWTFLQLLTNTVLLPILVITFIVSKRLKRHPVLINLCITWILSGLFSLLLFYAGEGNGSQNPDISLCIVQTSFMYGIPPMWSVAVFMLLYYILVSLLPNPKSTTFSDRKLALMLSSPYIVQCSFTIATLITLRHPDSVSRSRRFFYCTFQPHHGSQLSLAIAVFTSAVCLGIIVLKVLLIITTYRNWQCLRKAGQSNQVDFQLLLRVFTFGAYIIFGMAVNVVYIFDKWSIVQDMFWATAGMVIFLVFGTHPDVLRVWFSWIPHIYRNSRSSRAHPETIYHSNDFSLETAPIEVEKDSKPLPTPPTKPKPNLSISILPLKPGSSARVVLVNEDYEF